MTKIFFLVCRLDPLVLLVLMLEIGIVISADAVGFGDRGIYYKVHDRRRLFGRSHRFRAGRQVGLGLHWGRTFSSGGRSSAAAAGGRCSAAESEVAALKLRVGHSVVLGSVRLFDFIVSLAFRVKGRRRRFWLL